MNYKTCEWLIRQIILSYQHNKLNDNDMSNLTIVADAIKSEQISRDFDAKFLKYKKKSNLEFTKEEIDHLLCIIINRGIKCKVCESIYNKLYCK